MTKKKLLVFASTFPRWKNDTNPPFVYELSKRLTKEFEVHVLAPHYPKAKEFEIMDKMKVYRFRYFFEKYEKLAGSGGILPTLKKNKFYYLQIPFFITAEFFALKKLVKKIQPDIIHAHWIIPQGFVAALVKKVTGVDYVVTSHGSDLMTLKILNPVKKFVLKNAKRVTVVSNELKNSANKIYQINNISVIPMGVDSKVFNPNKKDLSIKKKYNINGPFLLFVGRLAPEKGINYLIEAMPKILQKYPKTKLMIIGNGTLREELIKKSENLGISQSIIFMGWINNKELPKYYATADIFVSPSLREGSPVTYIEARSSGCEIIVGDIPVAREIVSQIGGDLVSQNSIEISSKLISRLNNKIKKKNYFSKIENVFSWKASEYKFLEVLKNK